jgi:hypothetical protein
MDRDSSTHEREDDSIQDTSGKVRRKGTNRKTQKSAGGNIKTDLLEQKRII